MNDLTVINQKGKLVVDSRDIAKMIEKDHSHLMRDIKGYIEILGKSNFGLANFFIESAYQDAQDKTRPCYLLTKQGCDMVANKMTGEKGVLFTAAYVTKFEEMEKQLTKPQCLEDVLIQSLQEMKVLRQQVNETKIAVSETKEEVQAIRDTISINPEAEWRKQTNTILNKIGRAINDYKVPKDEAYNALKVRGNCRPKILINNLKSRALMHGMAKSKVESLNILDVIENEPRLKEIYISIIREMAIKYKVTWI